MIVYFQKYKHLNKTRIQTHGIQKLARGRKLENTSPYLQQSTQKSTFVDLFLFFLSTRPFSKHKHHRIFSLLQKQFTSQ